MKILQVIPSLGLAGAKRSVGDDILMASNSYVNCDVPIQLYMVTLVLFNTGTILRKFI